MTRTNIRITELMTRLTALERERAAIVAEIDTLQSAPSEQTTAFKVIPSEKAGDLVDRNSTIENKIARFRRLFRGRSDVFPIRWENRKTGRSGYAPACANEWQRGICEKPKVKCSACPIPFVHETEHPAFYRYRESYPRRNGSLRCCITSPSIS